jgi:hypothetical protein
MTTKEAVAELNARIMQLEKLDPKSTVSDAPDWNPTMTVEEAIFDLQDQKGWLVTCEGV